MTEQKRRNGLLPAAVRIIGVVIALQLAWVVLKPLLPWLAVIAVVAVIWRLWRWRRERW